MIPLKRIFFLTIIMVNSPCAQSIAALLDNYQIVSKKEMSIVSNSQISGGAYDPNTGTLLIVDNGNCNIYEVKTTGELLGTISLSKFEDVEGIAFQEDRKFIVAEEQRGNVVQITLPQSRSGAIEWNSCEKLNIGTDWKNSGLEDITYLVSSKTGFGVKEKTPTAIFQISFDNSGKPLESHEITSFNWSGIKGDVAGVYVLDDGNLLLLSQEANTLYGVDTTGKILSQIHLSMTQPEGVTFNKAENIIYIVGEPRELVVLKLNSSTNILSKKNKISIPATSVIKRVSAWKSAYPISLLGRRTSFEKDRSSRTVPNTIILQHGSVFFTH